MANPRATSKSSIVSLAPSKWLIQASPPDHSEARTRWTFGLYEILDNRVGPFDPRVLHTVYRGVIELEPGEVPPAADPLFAPKLEEAVVAKFKAFRTS